MIEVMPPIKNAIVVYAWPNSCSATKKSKMAKPVKKKARKVYSYLRKVIAPYIIVN